MGEGAGCVMLGGPNYFFFIVEWEKKKNLQGPQPPQATMWLRPCIIRWYIYVWYMSWAFQVELTLALAYLASYPYPCLFFFCKCKLSLPTTCISQFVRSYSVISKCQTDSTANITKQHIFCKLCCNLTLFRKYIRVYHFWILEFVEIEFSMVLKFHELKYHKKCSSKFEVYFFK